MQPFTIRIALKYCGLLFLVSAQFSLSAQHRFTDSTTRVNKKRLALVAGTSIGALGGSYIYLQNVWWSDQKSHFKVDHDMDYRYAKNMDKVAHFIGGAFTADLFSQGFNWAGVSESRSLLYAGLMGTAIQGMIEVKDAYAPTYGFSMGDLAAGAAGSFFPLFQYYVPPAKALTIKLSYYKHDPYYYDVFAYAEPIDDYMNQTYWLSASINDWLPEGSRAEKIWPDFLTIAGGWGVDNTLNLYYLGQNLNQNKGRGHFEYYLSIDVDWRKIIKQNTRFKKGLAYTLNYIKLPLPTLQLGPDVKGYWAFW